MLVESISNCIGNFWFVIILSAFFLSKPINIDWILFRWFCLHVTVTGSSPEHPGMKCTLSSTTALHRHVGLTACWLNLALLYCKTYTPVWIFTLTRARLTSLVLWLADFQHWCSPTEQSCKLRYEKIYYYLLQPRTDGQNYQSYI